MSESIVAINYKSLQEYGEEFWIRMEQELPDDLATVAEAAEVIDKIFELDPCVAVEEDQEAEEQPSSEETMAQAKEVFLEHLLGQKESLCLDGNGCFAADVRVYRSHQDRPYTLLITGGEAGQTVVGNAERVIKTVTVKDSRSVAMDFPADQSVSVAWQGPCYSKALGRLDVHPELIVSKGGISWGVAVTGVLRVEYDLPYDLVTILTSGKECGVTALYHLSTDDIDLQPPPEDDEAMELCNGGGSHFEDPDDDDQGGCYAEVTHKVRCLCTNADSGESYKTRHATGCPDGVAPGTVISRSDDVSYKYCDTIDDVNDPEYYEDKCCTPPYFVLPKCKKTYGIYSGGAGVNKDEAESLQKTYGSSLRFIPVGPKGGPCGEAVTEQAVHAKNCCDGAPQLYADNERTQDIMSPNSAAVVYVLGGLGTLPEDTGCVRRVLPTRKWAVSGADVWLDYNHSRKSGENNSNCVRIYSGPDACGSVHVHVTDGCSGTSVTLRVTVGGWRLIGEEVYDGKTKATLECPISGVGTEIADNLYELIEGRYRVIEKVGCAYLNGAWPMQFPPYIETYCGVWAYYKALNMPYPNWPGCVTPLSTAACSCDGYSADRCDECAPGGIIYQQSGASGFRYAYMTMVSYRQVYEWGC